MCNARHRAASSLSFRTQHRATAGSADRGVVGVSVWEGPKFKPRSERHVTRPNHSQLLVIMADEGEGDAVAAAVSHQAPADEPAYDGDGEDAAPRLPRQQRPPPWVMDVDERAARNQASKGFHRCVLGFARAVRRVRHLAPQANALVFLEAPASRRRHHALGAPLKCTHIFLLVLSAGSEGLRGDDAAVAFHEALRGLAFEGLRALRAGTDPVLMQAVAALRASTARAAAEAGATIAVNTSPSFLARSDAHGAAAAPQQPAEAAPAHPAAALAQPVVSAPTQPPRNPGADNKGAAEIMLGFATRWRGVLSAAPVTIPVENEAAASDLNRLLLRTREWSLSGIHSDHAKRFASNAARALKIWRAAHDAASGAVPARVVPPAPVAPPPRSECRRLGCSARAAVGCDACDRSGHCIKTGCGAHGAKPRAEKRARGGADAVGGDAPGQAVRAAAAAPVAKRRRRAAARAASPELLAAVPNVGEPRIDEHGMSSSDGDGGGGAAGVRRVDDVAAASAPGAALASIVAGRVMFSHALALQPCRFLLFSVLLFLTPRVPSRLRPLQPGHMRVLRQRPLQPGLPRRRRFPSGAFVTNGHGIHVLRMRRWSWF